MRRARNSIASHVFGRSRDALTILANRYGSDKGDKAHGRHCYTEIYDRLFCSKRLEPIAFLEIGLLHPLDTHGAPTRASVNFTSERISRTRRVARITSTSMEYALSKSFEQTRPCFGVGIPKFVLTTSDGNG